MNSVSPPKVHRLTSEIHERPKESEDKKNGFGKESVVRPPLDG